MCLCPSKRLPLPPTTGIHTLHCPFGQPAHFTHVSLSVPKAPTAPPSAPSFHWKAHYNSVSPSSPGKIHSINQVRDNPWILTVFWKNVNIWGIGSYLQRVYFMLLRENHKLHITSEQSLPSKFVQVYQSCWTPQYRSNQRNIDLPKLWECLSQDVDQLAVREW